MLNRKIPTVLLCCVLGVPAAAAEDARRTLQAAARTMGVSNIQTIEVSGTGWFGQVGQSYDLDSDWPRFEVANYNRVIDYSAEISREDLTRRRGSYPAVGGGLPFSGNQTITELVSGEYAWNMENGRAVSLARKYLDGVPHADFRRLDIVLTPHGFIKAALDSSDASAIKLPIVGASNGDLSQNGRIVTIVSFTALGKYKVNGTINDENLVEIVSTWVPNPVYGDMLFEMRYTEYEEFDGVLFPTVLHEHQGDPAVSAAHHSLEIRVSDVRINPDVAEIAVPESIWSASPVPLRTDSEQLAERVWRIAGGSHHSVLVEFDDFLAVVEAPLNEMRSLAVIEEIERLVPDKSVRYVINTHHHFDHSGGLRTFLAQGTTIVTHRGNRDFYQSVAFAPGRHSLEPDRLARFYPMFAASRRPAPIEGVGQKYVLSDGYRTVDVYPVRGLAHTETMVIVYLPEERIVINADMYDPGVPVQSSRLPEMRTLAENIERLGLDVEQHVGIHGEVGSHEEFLGLIAGE